MIRYRVLILLTASLLAIVSFLTFHLHYQGIDAVLSRFQGHQSSYANHLANEIRFFIQARSRGLSAIAMLPSVRQGDEPRQTSDIRAYAREIETVYVDEIFRLDERGNVVVSTNPNAIGTNHARRPFFQWARNSRGKAIVQLFPLLPDRTASFILAIPLRQEGEPGGFAGVLAFTLDMKGFLAHQLSSVNPRLNRDQVWIVDKDGTLLFQNQHPEMAFRNIYQQEENCFQCHLSFAYVEEILTKRRGTADYAIRNHPKKIAAFAPMEYGNLSWVVVVNNPYDEVTGFIKTSLHEHLILLGTVVVALAIGSGLMIRYERMKIKAEEQVSRWQERMAERAKAEEALQLERDKLNGILNSLNDGVYIVNQRCEVLYTNPVIGNEFGPTLGRKCHDYFHGLPDVCAWCKKDGVFSGKTVRWEWVSPVSDRTYDLIDTPITGPDGKLCKMQILHDITDQKKAERALRQSERRYRLLVETMSDGLGVQDERGTWLYVNDRFCEMLGYSREEMLGRQVTDFLGEAEQLVYQEQVARRRQGERGSYELPWLRKDGQKLFSLVSPKPMFDEQGRYRGSFAVVTGITERKLAEEALKESEKQLRSLSSQLLTAQETERKRISRELHDELGQALMVMKLKFNFIEKNLSENQSGLKQECEHGLVYIDQIIENVRRLSRDLSPSILEDFGLSAAIRWLINNFARSHTMKVSLEMIDVDSLLPQRTHVIIYRIVQEGLTNVARHSNAKNVRIVVAREKETVTFVLEDDGKGFKSQAFVKNGPDEKGLGLETMKGRARMLGGLLAIESEEGKGTRVRLTIPI